MTCPSPCDPDCDSDCHEWHQVRAKRLHDPHTCPGATESGLRRDLETEEDRRIARTNLPAAAAGVRAEPTKET